MISEHLSTLFIPPVERCVLCQNSTQKKPHREIRILHHKILKRAIYIYILYMCFSYIFVRAPNPHPKYRPLHWPCTNELPRKDDKAGINGRLPKQKCFKLNMHLKTNSPLSVATQLNSWLFYLLDLFSCEYFVGCVLQMGLSDPFKEYRFTCFQLIEKQVQDWQEPKKGCNLIPRTSSQMPNAFLAYVFDLSTFIIMTTCLLQDDRVLQRKCLIGFLLLLACRS